MTQVYGASGFLFGGNPSVAALEAMEQEFLKAGTTSFLATMATNSVDVFRAGLDAAASFLSTPRSIGTCCGIHFEGPFLNPKRRGAHPIEFIRSADDSSMSDYIMPRSKGLLKMMTVAPELAKPSALKTAQAEGVVLSCGHSNATYEEGSTTFTDLGIGAVTHLYNAMPPIHHRDPGLIAAIFERAPYVSIVVDGVHVDYAMVRLAKRELGRKLFLITDAVTSCSEGVYQHVFCGDRYTMPDGTLSGSSLSMLSAVQNCVMYCDIPLVEAIRMGSTYPAQVLGISDKKGSIDVGLNADFVIFDEKWNVKSTYVAGKRMFDGI